MNTCILTYFPSVRKKNHEVDTLPRSIFYREHVEPPTATPPPTALSSNFLQHPPTPSSTMCVTLAPQATQTYASTTTGALQCAILHELG